ncbi:MAG: aminotransferase class I/II-fold pyridoxal phosphate-dependent enzyme [Eubacteriales bacterium]|nr:aminotransferase class I/II-fold pyridoxal phosphate-dependent enzyme [Eubacteriales bacterium]MDD4390977.1 aminotransferase class I/II-fold pyridoxal phosphate-dependent enzyme [Eubacteriales bacterium]
MSKRLIDHLIDYVKLDIAPFHTPGHKRTSGTYDYLEKISYRCDLTEIEGFDNLHGANGILKDAMIRASEIYQSERTFFSVNGSSAGILAGIRAATKRGDDIIVARNCHKSVYNAIELCGLSPHFIMPQRYNPFKIYGAISPDDVKNSIKQYPKAALIVITSPTYEGIISDIRAICDEAHINNIPVIIDEAHGAHLGFLDKSIENAISCGADIVVHSAHKTLSSLTQTALVHANGNLIDVDELEWQLSVFQTTSPSYLLMASLDGCIDYIKYNKENAFEKWLSNLEKFEQMTKNLKHLRILKYASDTAGTHPAIYKFDKSKIIISTNGTSLNGATLASNLLNKYRIEHEMSLGSCVTMMTGMGTTACHLERLAEALIEIDASCKSAVNNSPSLIFSDMPYCAIPIEEARLASTEPVRLEQAEGRIIARYMWAYPPGAPFLIPGEIINGDLIKFISESSVNGTALKHNGKAFDGNIVVVKHK